MKRFISYGSIPQFRQTIKDIKHLNKGPTLPKIKVTLTEKIHGTNASVCLNSEDFWVQSRKNIITLEQDNAGCANRAYENKDAWEEILNFLAKENEIDLNMNTISVYYEWAGGNIQKNSALSGVPKKAIIFKHFKVTPHSSTEESDTSYWLETKGVSNQEKGIYNITNSKQWQIEIDFAKPSKAQNEMIQLVEEIEKNSPLGNQFEKEGNIGEGVVATLKYMGRNFRFKVKGEKHSKTKVKILPPVDEIFEQKRRDFANKVATPARLEQAWQELFGIQNEKQEPSNKFIGEFIKTVNKDVIKEESDQLIKEELTMKQVGQLISRISRNWFIEQLDKEQGIK